MRFGKITFYVFYIDVRAIRRFFFPSISTSNKTKKKPLLIPLKTHG